MGLTKQQQMPELWTLRNTLIETNKTLMEGILSIVNDDEYYDVLNGVRAGYALVIRWIDQFFEESPQSTKKIDLLSINPIPEEFKDKHLFNTKLKEGTPILLGKNSFDLLRAKLRLHFTIDEIHTPDNLNDIIHLVNSIEAETYSLKEKEMQDKIQERIQENDEPFFQCDLCHTIAPKSDWRDEYDNWCCPRCTNYNGYTEILPESFSFADVMELFMKFHSKFQRLSKKNVSREYENELNNLQKEIDVLFNKLELLFYKIPVTWREGK